MFKHMIAAAAMVISALVAVPLQADVTAKPAITQTIQSQIDAFRADDFEQAFTFASPNIQGIFGTAQTFGRMVQQGYPMVHRPSAVQFLDLREDGGVLVQRVQVRDAQGKSHLLEYQMMNGENGWKINGVQLLKGQGQSA